MSDIHFSADTMAVVVDTPCRKCQYNLRSLPIAGRCPECGTPIGLSMKGDLLRYSDPAWLHTMRRGVNCMIATIVAVIFQVTLSPIGNRTGSSIVGIVALIISCVGAWLVTTPDPSGLGEDKYGTSRRIIRVTLFFNIVSELTNRAEHAMVIAPSIDIYIQVIASVAIIAGTIGQIAELNYMSKLAARIPDGKITVWIEFLLYAIGISNGIVAVFAVVSKFVAVGGRLNPFTCIMVIAVFSFLIFFLMYLVVLWKFGRRLKEAEAFSRQTWAVAISPI